jgi:hypothetical protein
MESRPQYDVPTAVTFLMAGVGIGSLLAILFARSSDRPPVFPSARTDRTTDALAGPASAKVAFT